MLIMDDSEKITRIYEDMYFGRGKDDPSVITRLDRIEQILASLATWKWIMIAAILTMIGDIISTHIK